MITPTEEQIEDAWASHAHSFGSYTSWCAAIRWLQSLTPEPAPVRSAEEILAKYDKWGIVEIKLDNGSIDRAVYLSHVAVLAMREYASQFQTQPGEVYGREDMIAAWTGGYGLHYADDFNDWLKEYKTSKEGI